MEISSVLHLPMQYIMCNLDILRDCILVEPGYVYMYTVTECTCLWLYSHHEILCMGHCFWNVFSRFKFSVSHLYFYMLNTSTSVRANNFNLNREIFYVISVAKTFSYCFKSFKSGCNAYGFHLPLKLNELHDCFEK